MSHVLDLPPDAEILASHLAARSGMDVGEYLRALVIEALVRRAASEPSAPAADHLSDWEKAMERHAAPPTEEAKEAP